MPTMKISVASVLSFVAAVVVGVACLALFVLISLGDSGFVTGVYQSPVIYAGWPVVALLGVSVAFAYWRLSAARIFAIVSGVVFFGPIISLYVAAGGSTPEGELNGFFVLGALSILANWHIASFVRWQLRKAPIAQSTSRRHNADVRRHK